MIFMAGSSAYAVLHDHKNGWNPEAFKERYSEVLERYDYVVGDWGYNQLRLRGFYKDGHPKALKDGAISSLVDYINEYCNFGCAYFVLSKTDSKSLPPEIAELKPETMEAAVALSETGEQAAETAAAFSGPIMRWPLKERPGGPARPANVTVSAAAVARAAAERDERRGGRDQSPGSSSGRGQSSSRQGQDGGGNANRHGRPHGGQGQGGGDRRPPQGQDRHNQSSGKPHNNGNRGPRPQGGDDGGRAKAEQPQRHASDNGDNASRGNGGNPAGGSSGGGNRWSSKNRRRKSFGGKPGGHRPEGGPRPEAGGTPRGSGE